MFLMAESAECAYNRRSSRRPCLRGFSTQCQGKMLGGAKFTVHRDGNMAQYFLVNNAQANLAPIPDGLSDHQAVWKG